MTNWNVMRHQPVTYFVKQNPTRLLGQAVWGVNALIHRNGMRRTRRNLADHATEKSNDIAVHVTADQSCLTSIASQNFAEHGAVA